MRAQAPSGRSAGRRVARAVRCAALAAGLAAIVAAALCDGAWFTRHVRVPALYLPPPWWLLPLLRGALVALGALAIAASARLARLAARPSDLARAILGGAARALRRRADPSPGRARHHLLACAQAGAAHGPARRPLRLGARSVAHGGPRGGRRAARLLRHRRLGRLGPERVGGTGSFAAEPGHRRGVDGRRPRPEVRGHLRGSARGGDETAARQRVGGRLRHRPVALATGRRARAAATPRRVRDGLLAHPTAAQRAGLSPAARGPRWPAQPGPRRDGLLPAASTSRPVGEPASRPGRCHAARVAGGHRGGVAGGCAPLSREGREVRRAGGERRAGAPLPCAPRIRGAG